MPRELTFQIKNKEFAVIPQKVDRKKLYGWVEILALDEQERPCDLASTDDTGTLVIPRGGTALGVLSPDGKWVDRSELKTVDEHGNDARQVPSSYNDTIILDDKVSEDDFLDYSITDFYQLEQAPAGFTKAIGKAIYKFDYSYLDSYEATPAFIMVADKTPFMLLGQENRFGMLCLGDCGDNNDDDDDYIDISDDDIDFSMF